MSDDTFMDDLNAASGGNASSDPFMQDLQAASAPDQKKSTANSQSDRGYESPAPLLDPFAPIPQRKLALDNLFSGIGHGVTSVAQSIDQPIYRLGDAITGGNVAPGMQQWMQGQNREFQQKAQGSGAMQAGNVIGQIGATAPLLEMGGAGLDAAGTATGQNALTDFLLGNGGQTGTRLATGAPNSLAAMGTGYASKAAQGSLLGGGNALLTYAGTNQNPEDYVRQGMETGAAFGAGGSAAADMGSNVASMVGGKGISPQLAQLYDLAKNKYGIELSAPELSSSPFVKFLNSTTARVPFSGGAERAATQADQFSKAVAGTFGAQDLTQEGMQAARQQLRNNYNSVAANVPAIQAGTDFQQQLSALKDEASQVLTGDQMRPLENQINAIQSKIKPGIGGDSVSPEGNPGDYIYHGTPSKNIDSIRQNGLIPSTQGMEGEGTYFGQNPQSIYNYVDDNASVLRVNKQAMIDKYGAYHAQNNPSGLLYGAGENPGEDLLLDKSAGNVPPHMLEMQTEKGWQPLVPNNGVIDSKTYKAVTDFGSPLDRLTKSTDPNVRFYASKLGDLMDGALEQSASPEDLQLLKQTNRQWKNMKTVEGLAAKSTPDGNISAPNLASAVRKSFKDYAYTGGGDLGELAQIGQLMKEPPSSGTAERGAAMASLFFPAERLVNGDVSGAVHDVAAGAGMVGASRATQSVLNSDWYKNQLLRGLTGGASGANGALPSNQLLSNIAPYGGVANNMLTQSGAQLAIPYLQPEPANVSQ